MYLHGKLLYWFYGRRSHAHARPYADRLIGILRRADAKRESVRGEECRSLIYELKGNLREAIRCREREIELLTRSPKDHGA